MKTSTQPTALRWYHLDADGKILGRFATEVAGLLIGKQEPEYAPHKLPRVYVVVTNTDKIRFTGNKLKQKMYYSYSGYSGGLRQRPLEEQMKRDSRKVIFDAVYGMLPKNSLRDHRMKQLKLYAGSEHPHLPQLNPSSSQNT